MRNRPARGCAPRLPRTRLNHAAGPFRAGRLPYAQEGAWRRAGPPLRGVPRTWRRGEGVACWAPAVGALRRRLGPLARLPRRLALVLRGCPSSAVALGFPGSRQVPAGRDCCHPDALCVCSLETSTSVVLVFTAALDPGTGPEPPTPAAPAAPAHRPVTGFGPAGLGPRATGAQSPGPAGETGPADAPSPSGRPAERWQVCPQRALHLPAWGACSSGHHAAGVPATAPCRRSSQRFLFQMKGAAAGRLRHDGQPQQEGHIWGSMRRTAFILGSGLLLLVAFWNSVTWHLQRFWGASGHFWQTQWERLLTTFEGKEWLLYLIGATQVPALLFWAFNGLLLVVDTTGKPHFISRYRIQQGKNEPAGQHPRLGQSLVPWGLAAPKARSSGWAQSRSQPRPPGPGPARASAGLQQGAGAGLQSRAGGRGARAALCAWRRLPPGPGAVASGRSAAASGLASPAGGPPPAWADRLPAPWAPDPSWCGGGTARPRPAAAHGPPRQVDPERLRQSVRTVLFNQFAISLPVMVALYPALRRWRDPCRHALPTFHRFLLELVLFTLLEEVLFYYSHRLLHHPALYKKIHKKHHEWTAPIGVVALYAHPIEHVASNMVPVLAGPLLLGSHLSSLTVWLSLALIVTTISHCGYHLPFLPSPEFHDYHHLKFNQCYGVLGVLDHLHGTDAVFKQTKAYERHTLLLGFTPLSESIPDTPKKMH
ncbi:Fatty acid hydroxylase domain-containing protein 2 [Galemys pyrenaicus]|uniref:Fatty acid hydroxylase domain-containing protein 2 n=1 Tax=Galemys pyrenaicus TaxID=202257 RepID=A0A8J5ZWM7_GALPY|nr:Fatty acid hydroxylase domain-containing protein 2 [Galemys pyrenaicus]